MEKKYRKNVAIVVFNNNKKILLCERINSDNNSWQFPQGGMDRGENIEVTAYRELFEETSIKSAKLVKILDNPFKYDFPKDIRDHLWKNRKSAKYYGQEQYWVLMYFYGDNSEIDLNTQTPEFKSYKWEDCDFAINNIVDFKKDVYIKALAELSPYIDNYF